jgi:MFS family permease
VLGAVIATVSLRGTPNVVHRAEVGLRFTGEVLHNSAAMRLIVGYTFHNWELWGMFTWAPAFMGAVVAASGTGSLRAVQIGAQISATFHLVGLLASSSMGRLADRLGSRTLLLVLAGASTVCSLAFGWLIHWPLVIVVVVGVLYGFTAVGDSPVLSSALTQVVTPSYLGAALALRALLGWGASSVAPLVFGAVLDATNGSGATPTVWGWAFSSLAIAGCGAIFCAAGLPATARRALS